MIPEDYQKKLNEFEKFFPNFISNVPYIYDVDINKKMKFTSEEHLNNMLINNLNTNYGTSEESKGFSWNLFELESFSYFWEEESLWLTNLLEDMEQFCQYLSAIEISLWIYYFQHSFVSWHTNSDMPGISLLFSWSKEGDGYFKSYNPKTENFEIYKDNVGWNVKGLHVPTDEESLTLGTNWHYVETTSPRYTIGFFIRKPEVKKDFCEEILEEFQLKRTPNGNWV